MSTTRELLQAIASQGAEKGERLAYTERELCAAIGVSKVTMWRLRKAGLIRAVEGLGIVLYARSEVERFLEGRSA